MSENNEKCPSQFPKAQIDVFKCFVLSDRQSKTQTCSVYHHRRLKKPSNIHIWEAGTTGFFAFWLDNKSSVDRLISPLNQLLNSHSVANSLIVVWLCPSYNNPIDYWSDHNQYCNRCCKKFPNSAVCILWFILLRTSGACYSSVMYIISIKYTGGL